MLIKKSNVLSTKLINRKTVIKNVKHNNILLDDTYQREIDKKLVKEIANSFNFVQFGVLIVGYRVKTNQFFCVDGQHRLAAYLLFLKHTGEKAKTIPCQIFTSSGSKEEAELYIKLQEKRKPLKDYDKYKASVVAGSPICCEIDRWVKDNNFRVVKSPLNTNNSVCFVKQLVTWWKKDSTSQKEALLIQRSILNETETLDYLINAGLCYLCNKGVDIIPHISKIKKEGGKNILKTSIKSLSTLGEMYSDVNKEQLKALAILNVVNKGKRSRKVKMRLADV